MFVSSVTMYSSPLLHSPNLLSKLQQNQNLVGGGGGDHPLTRLSEVTYSDIDSRVVVVAP